jgi:ribosome-binding protein aMBF1 (putative translation factor)
MSAIKIIAETADTVTVARQDWLKLLADLEDAEDRAAVRERRAFEKSAGISSARQNYLTAAEARRLLEGENPVKIWRQKRGLSQRALAAKALVGNSYLAEIENGRKPGSRTALRKLAVALEIRPEDLDPEDLDIVSG